jgi:tRNA U34 5-methylaminomethyl-2-thiouridine-forming methyltransferase MnmC
MGFSIINLTGGDKTLRSLVHGETFHPGIGPLAEARLLHVEQQRLLERCQENKKFVLWDVGFGAAANTIAAFEAVRSVGGSIEIHSFDKSTEAIDFALEHHQELSYLTPHQALLKRLLKEGFVQEGNIRWHLHLGDFRQDILRHDLPAPHSIFYDPYSPATNREMWTLPHFENLYKHLAAPCLLTNYTRSTAVRVTFLLAGFYLGIGCSLGQKRETSIMSNRLELLDRPLDRKWLERVKISHNSAPIRGDDYVAEPIQNADLERLELHPQFC